MKNVKSTALLFILYIFSLSVYSQEFEGEIKYKISYGDLPEEMKAYESMLPDEMNFLVKGEKSKMTQPSAMGGETVVISDQAKKESTILINSMGYKVAITKDLSNENKPDPKIEYVDGNKEIAGYLCNKAILTDDNGIKTTLWYTEDLPALDINLGLKGIKGLPLEFESEQNGINAKIVANTVTEKDVDESEFMVPEGYKTMTEEEFQQMMQGQGGGM